MKHFDIVVLVDAGAIPADDPEFQKNGQKTSEGHVANTLRELGHNVRILGVGFSVEDIFRGLSHRPPDLVFNLTEQFRDDRRLDTNIAGLLELMGMKFTGAGSAGLMICRDKGLCKQLLSLHKIRVPGFVVLPPRRSVRVPKSLNFPVIVKPIYEDASDGISNASIVKDEPELRDRAQFVHVRWNQLAIAEEYIAGQELYVGVLGNKRLTVLAPREIRFKDDSSTGPVIATSRVKWDKEYRKKWKIQYGFAKLPDDILRNISRVCKKVYRLLQMRDYGRIDIRLTTDNKIVILEANPNPDIAYGEDVAEAAGRSGIDYTHLIDKIVQAAMHRYE